VEKDVVLMLSLRRSVCPPPPQPQRKLLIGIADWDSSEDDKSPMRQRQWRARWERRTWRRKRKRRRDQRARRGRGV